MTADSTYMSASVKSFPYSFSDKSQLKDEIIIKDDELTYDEKCHNLGVYCYNPKYHEVCARDGEGWAKISLFYFVWFMLLAGIFASLLGIFMAIIDKRIPTFRGNSSALALDTYNLNPGLGFRPQISVEKTLIKYRSSTRDGQYGWGEHKNQLDTFLSYYTEQDLQYQQQIDCTKYSLDQLPPLFRQGKSCWFNLLDLNFDKSPCVSQRNFEYDRGHPCVLIKLNKIYEWVPIPYENVAEVPERLKSIWDAKMSEYILVQCDGENDVDRDFIYELEYYSPLQNTKIGGFPRYFFPYLNQDGYRSPLVFVYFKKIETNVLINVECRAYAKNINHDDSIEYKRGSVHFELIVE